MIMMRLTMLCMQFTLMNLVSGMWLVFASLIQELSVKKVESMLEKLKWLQTSLFIAVAPCSRMFMTLRMVNLKIPPISVPSLVRCLSRCRAYTVLT